MSTSIRVPYEALDKPAYQTGTFLGDIIRGAGSLACTMQRDYNQWANSGISWLYEFSEGFTDELCGVPPTPVPPMSVPFQGGQCVGEQYDILHEQLSGGVLVQVTLRRSGKVLGIQNESQPGGTVKSILVTSGGAVVDGLGDTLPANWEAAGGYPKILNISPVDGTDDCGNPLPEREPISPPAGEATVINNVNISPTVAIPLAFVYIRPTVNVDVDANIPVNIDLRPTVYIEDLNIGLKFGNDAVEIQPYLPPKADRRPILPDIRFPEPKLPPAPSLDTTEIIRRILAVSTKLNLMHEDIIELLECACPDKGTIKTIVYQDSDSRNIACPPRTFAARVQLVTITNNVRTQFGGNAPTVSYAGWAWFEYLSAGMGERQHLDSANKLFIPVEAPTRFAYTATYGCIGRMTLYYLE